MARAFKFRLQTVLDLALRIQDQKAQAMAQAQAIRQEALDRLESIRGDQDRKREELLAAQTAGAIDIQTIQWGLDYIGILADQAHRQQAEVAEADRLVEAARQELRVAAQEVQVLQKLRDKAKAEYQAKLDHAEAVLIDELSTVRFVRQKALNFGD